MRSNCRSSAGLSAQRVEQRPGFLQIGRIEALREPAMDRPQEIAGVVAFALVAPEPAKAAGGPQFPEPGALPARRLETALKAGLGLRRIGESRQQRAFRPMDLRLAPALAGLVDLLQGFVEKIDSVPGRA